MNPLSSLRLWLALYLFSIVIGQPAVLRWRTVTASQGTSGSILRNGGFEEAHDGKVEAWKDWQGGYTPVPGAGRDHSSSILCENVGRGRQSGASQTIVLNRTNAAPLVVRGWSKADAVSGSADSGYSIYVDLVYADGSPLWGQTGDFRCGTHDWQQREFVIIPERPIRSLTIHCLFRGHTGRAWFDDVQVEEIGAGDQAVLFQGVPVQPGPLPPDLPGATLRTADGFTANLAGGGFLARDAAANSDFIGFSSNVCPELRLKIASQFIERSNHILVRGRVTDASARDRAITLVFALPIDARGWSWGDDIRRSRVISGQREYASQVPVRAGSTGTESLYPLAAVWNAQTGTAVAIDMDHPAVYRVGYHAGLRQLFIAFDFGLVAETAQFPSSAEFEFALYRFPPKHGFRSAWQKLTEIFSGQFLVRSKEQGTWMPFTDVAKVPGSEDFGFRYHEGNNNVPWDDAHGVLSFRYTEPMTWWMRMSNGTPRAIEAALRVRDELAAGKPGSVKRMAELSRVAAMHNDALEPAMQFQDTPWCNGAVWSLNPNPSLAGSSFNAATVYWNPEIKQALYGPNARGKLDGEYLDSLEGYVTTDLNYRREHFRATTVPLTFSPETKQPVLFKGLAVFEFTRWLAADVHAMDKLMFANGVPYRFTYLCGQLDVLGTEIDWLRAGQYHPASIGQMDLWRTFSGAKPYLLLMNTDYDRFNTGLVEKYFERSLFYGMWPGFFSHNAADNPYWQNPKWYERDRPLFRKYIPLVRELAEAGWQPVTAALSGNTNILVEQFGSRSQGAELLAMYNDTASIQEAIITLEEPAASIAPLHGHTKALSRREIQVSLPSQHAAVVRLSR